MGHVVEIVNGSMAYRGATSSEEIASIDKILLFLQENIPRVESELKEKYGTGVLNKYHLGIYLGDLLEKFEITSEERRRFWDEIKVFASEEDRSRNEGKHSEIRSYYYQCYQLSKINENVIIKLPWSEWQSLLDRVTTRSDERLFSWLGSIEGKLSRSLWREFQKALNLYLTKKDTSVFSDDELYSIYNSLLKMCELWLNLYDDFKISHPKSHKVTKNKANQIWSKKYYQLCLKMKKEKRSLVITEEICKESFNQLMM